MAIIGANDLDGRRRIARRIKTLISEFTGAFGGAPAPHQQVLIRNAAELTAISEQMRAEMLTGGTVSSNDLVRTQNAMQRAIDALKFPSSPLQSENLGSEMQRLALQDEAQGDDDTDIDDVEEDL